MNELGRSWDLAAAGYLEYWVPRFRPWNDYAVARIVERSAALPEGPVLLPCCGPGQELEPLARGTGRPVLGFDLSAGMVELARARGAGTVEVADVQALAARFPRTAAALCSCFGLQQMAEPDLVLEDWARTLAPGGVLSVMSWPRRDDDDPAVLAMRRLVAPLSIRSPDVSWQDRLGEALRRAGAEILEDRLVCFPMHHHSAGAMWDAFVLHGSLRVVALRHGQAALDALRPRFVAELGEGPVEERGRARFHLAVAR